MSVHITEQGRVRYAARGEASLRDARSSVRVWLALILALGGIGCQEAPSGPPERIVLIVVDTLRRDHLACYGSQVPTLNIDRLAARGQTLTNAMSSFHQTTMSMAALFTGRTPSIESGNRRKTLAWTGRNWCGMSRFADPGSADSCIPRALATLGEAMSDAGYWTLGVASNALLFDPAGYSEGFADWVEVGRPHWRPGTLDPAERRQFYVAHDGTQVNAAVAEALERRPSDRFFLYAHYMDAHDYSLGAGRRSYERHVQQADAAVGALLEMLEDRGLAEDAVVVLTADHGERLEERHPVPGGVGHRGNPSFDYLLRVPLIVSPARFEDPTVPMRSEDLHRWLRTLAGLESVRPSELRDDELFLTEMKWQTYRSGRWKSTWFRRSRRSLLFDLLADPQERNDVAEAHPEVLAQHRQRIAELSRRLTAEGAAAAADALTQDDRLRLEALGYLEEEASAGSP